MKTAFLAFVLLLALALPVFAQNTHSIGSGSPEGAVTASVGSTYARTDGASATSFYIKATGTGNTGWLPAVNSGITSLSSLATVGTITSGVWNGTTIAVANGGTGTSSGSSGGVPYYSGTATIVSSGTLTASVPVLGGGAGGSPTSGARSGNTTTFATTSGSLTSGNCAKFDASGNVIDSGSVCGTSAVTSVANSDSSLTVSPTTGSVVASLNVGNANTWTALQTHTGGTNSGANRLLMTVTARTTNGLRNSSNIIWQGGSYDGTAHTIDYQAQTNPTANAGTSSYWSLATRLDAASFTNILTVQQDGTLTASGGVVAQSGNLVLNDMGISRTSTTLIEVNNTNVGSFLDLKVRQYFADATITAPGTTGDQTINKSLWSVNFPVGISFLTVTDSLITTSSLVICTPQKKGTLLTIAAEVHSGSVDLKGNAGADVETKVACIVFNN